MIPYGRQSIDDEDIKAVVEALKSDWLTTGPRVEDFEKAVCAFTGARHGVAVSNGTAGLHAAMYAAGIKPGDEVIVPTMTFAATANAVVFQQGTPVFADVLAENLLLDPNDVARKITKKTKAIIAVDYAGQPCDYDALRALATKHGLLLVADACHAIGATYKGRNVGTVADLTVFSFHPVKHITTGEGGMITTNDAELARRLKLFRNHGITTDHRQREQSGSWSYEMVELGYNYRITDIQCALGTSQLKKLPRWLERRRALAARYDEEFGAVENISPLENAAHVENAYHLYVAKFDFKAMGTTREEAFRKLRAAGIGVNVHYLPVHHHPFYRERFGTKVGQCPVAEAAYEQILSLPLYSGLSDTDQQTVITAVGAL